MKYEGVIIRPPSEAHSLLLQITVGCSHNKCTFCGTYKEKKFRIKGLGEIEEDILEAACYGRFERVFLCDGDALIIPQKKLVPILESIRTNIQGLKRIGTYGNAKSILRKTPEELKQLRKLGLKIVYLGVETGNESLLNKINKGVDYKQMVEAGRRIKQAGMKLSATVLLGIGGKDKSLDHARDTAKILTDIDPDYVGALTVMIIPGTPLHDEYISKTFELPDTFGFLEELGTIVSKSDFTNCFFTSNHASNYLPIRARMPEEKEETVRLICTVISANDRKILRPEFMRGL
ncbi:MAG: radical SAM protein [Deltaproteobacteria bacterium]|nr:radical SAM protein [Deltaproteobacteria bacterium]